ncbi:unnamed protein product [Adineta steineri]|uniref:Uncharacterized protein n=1 Tax=Adineta steineri TaxID=433720 RepID=A0A815HLZ1_9BILA|nr:unnamed protein product [Adineta steineri]
MLTIGIYLLNLFKHPIISWLGTILHFIINNIGEIKTIDQCRILHTFTADCFPLKIRNTISIEKDLDTLFGKQNDLFSTVLLTDAKSILTKLKTITQDQTNINDYPTWFLLTFQQQHCVFGRSSIPEHHAKIIGFDK